jgi:predicted RNA-binding Zn ribbon-like protein
LDAASPSTEATALLEFVNMLPSSGASASSAVGLSFDRLLETLVRGRILEPAEASAVSVGSSEAVEPLVREAARLHALLRDVLTTMADGRDLTLMQIEALNEVVAEWRGEVQLTFASRGLVWKVESRDPVRGALAKVVWSAVQLLTNAESTMRLRRCAGNCGAIFLDFTKNGSRRWCEMRGCGNRAKARRYYQRKRSLGSSMQPGFQADGVP